MSPAPVILALVCQFSALRSDALAPLGQATARGVRPCARRRSLSLATISRSAHLARGCPRSARANATRHLHSLACRARNRSQSSRQPRAASYSRGPRSTRKVFAHLARLFGIILACGGMFLGTQPICSRQCEDPFCVRYIQQFAGSALYRAYDSQAEIAAECSR